MPTYSPLDTLAALSAYTLRQLYETASYSRAAATSLEDDPNQPFSLFNTAKVLRPKLRGAAQDVDPRTGAITLTEQEWVETPITLNHIWGDGFPSFLIDARRERVNADSVMAIAMNIGASFEGMFYGECFRDYSHIASSGVVQYASGAPLRMVFKEDSTGTLVPFATDHLARANSVMEDANVPAAERFAFTSPMSAGDWAVAQPTAEGQSGAMAGGGQVIMQGLQQGRFIPRSGFNFGVARSVSGQVGVADLGDGTAVEAIAAFDADTTVFFDGDILGGTTPLGAVRCTIGVTAAMTGVAVGQLARLGPGNGPATAYGVIIRVDIPNKHVWLVPYNEKGAKLTAAQLATATDNFSVPMIPYLNTAHHREFLQFASRPLKPPTVGSGGILASQVLDRYGVAINYSVGAYSAVKMREDHVASLLCGCKAADHRKSLFMLSA